MKIVLINPAVDGIEETKTIPLGLAYLASCLKDEFEITVVDFTVDNDPETKLINSLKYADVIGISATIMSVANTRQIARWCKETNPEAMVVLGGPYPTSLPEHALGEGQVDLVVFGEGEQTFSEICQAAAKGKSLKEIRGLGYLENDKLVRTDRRELIADLDSIPFPQYDLFPLEKYSGFNVSLGNSLKTGSILTSRGCPYGCIYCFKGIFGGKWRFRSPENVVDEWQYQVEHLGVEEMGVVDDAFNINVQRAEKICDLLIERGLTGSWLTPQGVRGDLLPFSLVKKMKKSGCHRIAVGVENGNQEYLNKIVRKNLNLKKVREGVDRCKDAGIETVAFYILGLPGETLETMQQTIDFSISLDTDFAQFLIASPFPGTPFFDVVNERGKFLRDFEHYGGHMDNLPNFEMKGLPHKLLLDTRKKAYRKYYFRPKYIIRGLSNPLYGIRGAYYFVKRILTGG